MTDFLKMSFSANPETHTQMLHEIGSLMFVCIEEFISHQSMRVLVKTSEKNKTMKERS